MCVVVGVCVVVGGRLGNNAKDRRQGSRWQDLSAGGLVICVYVMSKPNQVTITRAHELVALAHDLIPMGAVFLAVTRKAGFVDGPHKFFGFLLKQGITRRFRREERTRIGQDERLSGWNGRFRWCRMAAEMRGGECGGSRLKHHGSFVIVIPGHQCRSDIALSAEWSAGIASSAGPLVGRRVVLVCVAIGRNPWRNISAIGSGSLCNTDALSRGHGFRSGYGSANDWHRSIRATRGHDCRTKYTRRGG